MVWPQYLDREHSLIRLFNVTAFRMYLVIDHEGVIRYQSFGWTRRRAVPLLTKGKTG